MSNIPYINEMGYKERGTWIELVVAIGVFLWYAGRILGNLDGTPIADVAFRGPMIRAMVTSIIATIVAHILYAMVTGATDTREDLRDRQVSRFGDWVGMWPLVAGAGGALILAMFEQDHFWIANALYVGFFVSSITSSIARLVSYRRGMVGA
jgi:hypothetical protein